MNTVVVSSIHLRVDANGNLSHLHILWFHFLFWRADTHSSIISRLKRISGCSSLSRNIKLQLIHVNDILVWSYFLLDVLLREIVLLSQSGRLFTVLILTFLVSTESIVEMRHHGLRFVFVLNDER